MLAYLFGNHEGRVEDLWVVGIAVIVWAVTTLFPKQPRHDPQQVAHCEGDEQQGQVQRRA